MATNRSSGTYINPQTFLVGATFQTTDGASSTSADSPASAASAGSDLTLVCPDYAAELVVVCDAATYVSEDGTFGSYYLLMANTEYRFGIGAMDKLFFRGQTADSNVWYRWVVV